MPNLTGAFDVAVETNLRAVNRVLAAQHQKTGPDRGDEIYIHSAAVRIPPTGRDGGAGVHGIAELQVSTPTITLPADDRGSRVTAHYQVRVHMIPSSESVAVPEFIHGEVQATVDVEQIASPRGDALAIHFEADDVEVSFTPDRGAPLDSAEQDLVNRVTDNFMRTAFEPVNLSMRLPHRDEFSIRHWGFKTMPGGARPTLALLFNLRDVAPTDAHRADFNNVFLRDGDDFAIGVGADFLRPRFSQLILDALRRRLSGRAFRVRFIFFTATYLIASLEDPVVELRNGSIMVIMRGRLVGERRGWPAYGFTLRQAFTLTVIGGTLTLDLAGDPDVDLHDGPLADLVQAVAGGMIRDQIRARREEILAEARPLIADMLSGFTDFLGNLLVSTLRTAYRSVEITPEGIAVHGNVSVARWREVAAAFETRTVVRERLGRPAGGAGPWVPEPLPIGGDAGGIPWLELNALNSWIPGGAIQRFRWFAGNPAAPVHESINEHQFVEYELSAGAPPRQWCLEVWGTQEGMEVMGRTCTIVGPRLPPWPPELTTIDLRLPVAVVGPTGTLVAHLDPWGYIGGRMAVGASAGKANLIVHFADSQPDAIVPALRDALAQSQGIVLPVVVLEPGVLQTLDTKDRLEDDFGRIAWAEDFEGHWTKTFHIEEKPATFLISSEGEMVWKQPGSLDAAELRAVFDKYLEKGGLLQVRRSRLKVLEGRRAPDFIFKYLQGREFALRMLRRRLVILNFWTSWSEPCLEQLRILQQLHDKLDPAEAVILAVNDGEDEKYARTFFEQHDFSCQFLADRHRNIARRYGVNCWPSTLLIDEKGIIRQIQLGVTHYIQGISPQLSQDTGQSPLPQRGDDVLTRS